MASKPNDRARPTERAGRESEDEARAARRRRGGEAEEEQPEQEGEPTDTLEDRNLSGSSTWATLLEQDQREEDE